MTASQHAFDPVPVKHPDGREWPSISACARDVGLHYSTVQRAIERGTLGNIGAGRGVIRKRLTCGDIEFPSIAAAAAWIGCSPPTIATRRQRAIDKGLDSFDLNGVTFQVVI